MPPPRRRTAAATGRGSSSSSDSDNRTSGRQTRQTANLNNDSVVEVSAEDAVESTGRTRRQQERWRRSRDSADGDAGAGAATQTEASRSVVEDEVEEVDLEDSGDDSIMMSGVTSDVIDLTEYSPLHDNTHVDLTETPQRREEYDDTPIVIDSQSENVLRTRTRLGDNPFDAPPPVTMSLDDSDDDDLPDLSAVCNVRRNLHKKNTPEKSKPPPTTLQSPESKSGITCPICMENDTSIRRKGGQVMSTTCGHLFCQECLTGVLKEYRAKCPTCRMGINKNKVHPIYV